MKERFYPYNKTDSFGSLETGHFNFSWNDLQSKDGFNNLSTTHPHSFAI